MSVDQQYVAAVAASLMLDHGMQQHDAYRALRRESAPYLLASGLPAADVATMLARLCAGRHAAP